MRQNPKAPAVQVLFALLGLLLVVGAYVLVMHFTVHSTEVRAAYTADQRDAILTATNDAGLMTRPTWTLMHRLAPYRDCPRMELPVAESLERRLINLPSSAHLGMVATQ